MSFFLPALLPCFFLSGCEVPDTSSVFPFSKIKTAPPELAIPGLNRTIETFTGKISWYSVKTNGGTRTASGERFSDSGDTAAHRSLRFGTLVEVTNLANNRSVILRITDRGPYAHGRILDVSIGAARKLDFVGNGVANCRIDVLRYPESPQHPERHNPRTARALETLPIARTTPG
jgi:rare lipoprotein A